MIKYLGKFGNLEEFAKTQIFYLAKFISFEKNSLDRKYCIIPIRFPKCDLSNNLFEMIEN